ncbi:MAG: GDP-L-fucose synthase family protein, partial [Burkholderiales bacterium]
RLEARGYRNLILRSRAELDLLNQDTVRSFLQKEKPDFIFLAAAKVGGILANSTYPAEFIYQNLTIENNVIDGAYRAGVENLLFLGSSCIYPRDCPQPIKEEYLLTGALEKTNEPYAIAKIAGIKLAESYNRQYGTRYVSVMPTNLYGPNDNYDPETSHVLPALIARAHRAKLGGDNSFLIWGSGNARREFLHVDDLADACMFLMELGIGAGLYNVGTGRDLTIRELAHLILRVVGLNARLEFDLSKPDGTPRKLLDISRLRQLGWAANIELAEGIARTYAEYRPQPESVPAL